MYRFRGASIGQVRGGHDHAPDAAEVLTSAEHMHWPSDVRQAFRVLFSSQTLVPDGALPTGRP